MGLKCNSASNKECTVNFDVDIQPDHIKNSTLTETMFYGKTSVWDMQTTYNLPNSRPNGSLDFTGTQHCLHKFNPFARPHPTDCNQPGEIKGTLNPLHFGPYVQLKKPENIDEPIQFIS